jgi:hypothetical protein
MQMRVDSMVSFHDALCTFRHYRDRMRVLFFSNVPCAQTGTPDPGKRPRSWGAAPRPSSPRIRLRSGSVETFSVARGQITGNFLRGHLERHSTIVLVWGVYWGV